MARCIIGRIWDHACLHPPKQRVFRLHTSLRQLQRHCSSSNGDISTPIIRWNAVVWYNDKLSRHPVLTKCVTAGVLYSAGDVIAQKVSLHGTNLDRPRILRAAIYGTFIVAPLAHIHFNFLNWLVVEKIAVRASLVPFVKVYFDQFVYWAPSIVAIYHLSMGIMEGLTRDQCMSRFKELYWRSLKANWSIWAPMMLINFSFIPVAHQLNFCLIVGMIWATVISYIRGRALIIEQGDTRSDDRVRDMAQQVSPQIIEITELNTVAINRVIYPEN